MFVFANLAMSLDGKIAPAKRGYAPLGTPLDRQRMVALRADADAVLFGASTLRAYRKPCRGPRSLTRQPANVIWSQRAEGLSIDWPFFQDRELRRILVLDSDTPLGRQRRFARYCDLIKLDPKASPRVRLQKLLKQLAARGVDRLLVEGGGTVMWNFVEHDAIDRFHVTLTPKLVGGADAPTLIDGTGFKPEGIRELNLVECEVQKNEIYLVYQRG